jgi:hypothetical protein
MFAILKSWPTAKSRSSAKACSRVLQDGFGFLRSARRQLSRRVPTISMSARARSAASACALATPSKGTIRAPEGRRALFRPAQGQHDQFRRPRDKTRHKVHFDNLTPLYPDRAAAHGIAADPGGAGRRTREGLDAEEPRSSRRSSTSWRRPDCAAGQGPARPDRRAAAHRQDGAAAEYRASISHNHPECLSDRSADRRTAGRSHRHAAHGEGRGDLLDLRRAGEPPCAGRRNGDRKGQAPGRAQAAMSSSCSTPSRVWAGPTTPLFLRRARC